MASVDNLLARVARIGTDVEEASEFVDGFLEARMAQPHAGLPDALETHSENERREEARLDTSVHHPP